MDTVVKAMKCVFELKLLELESIDPLYRQQERDKITNAHLEELWSHAHSSRETIDLLVDRINEMTVALEKAQAPKLCVGCEHERNCSPMYVYCIGCNRLPTLRDRFSDPDVPCRG